ncbi:hypothetical protein NCCP2495_20170 [Dietzia sp. NCCP-2495]|nr:glycosyltransferase 87 family protein [Dietzia sp. NCCP-2495]GLB64138.1 hypothetical protein NCCP2495_20170 [Dietzia sp. NCCP-2495]
MPRLTHPRLVLTWAGLLLTAAVTVMVLVQAATEFMLDLEVFQDVGRALVNGQDLYSEDFPTRSGFRFIYPPFGAIIFAPLAPLDATVAQVVWSAATIASVWAILAMVAVRLKLDRPGIIALALTGVALLSEPLRSNLMFGQINVFLFLMVTADVLGFTPRRFRGVLLGVAAGIKITPAAFALMFLVRRDWASLARSVAAVFATIVVGHLARPAESLHFWTHEFWVTDRGGHPWFVPNQALSGLLTRARLTPEQIEIPVLGFFLVAAIAATWGAWQFTRRDRPVDALLLVALGVFVASPVAVTHHWSGVIIAFAFLLVPRRPLVRWTVAALALSHLIGTHYAYAPIADSPGEHLLQWLVGNLQGMTGIAAFAVLVVDAVLSSRAGSRTRPGSAARPGSEAEYDAPDAQEHREGAQDQRRGVLLPAAGVHRHGADHHDAQREGRHDDQPLQPTDEGGEDHADRAQDLGPADRLDRPVGEVLDVRQPLLGKRGAGGHDLAEPGDEEGSRQKDGNNPEGDVHGVSPIS